MANSLLTNSSIAFALFAPFDAALSAADLKTVLAVNSAGWKIGDHFFLRKPVTFIPHATLSSIVHGQTHVAFDSRIQCDLDIGLMDLTLTIDRFACKVTPEMERAAGIVIQTTPESSMVVMAELQLMPGLSGCERLSDPQTGRTLRLCVGYDLATDRHRYVVDFLFGCES